jgi:hypothetical protein
MCRASKSSWALLKIIKDQTLKEALVAQMLTATTKKASPTSLSTGQRTEAANNSPTMPKSQSS